MNNPSMYPNSRMNTGALLVAALILVLPAPATALPIVQVDYSYTITNTFSGFPAPVLVSGVATYDFEAADSNASPSFGLYPLLSNVVDFGGTMLSPTTSATGSFFSSITVQDQVSGSPPIDRWTLGSTLDFVTSGITVTAMKLELEGPDTIFTGDALFIPDPTDFSLLRSGSIEFISAAGAPSRVSANPAELSFSILSIPEPATVLLLGVGLLGLVFAKTITRRNSFDSGIRL